MTLEEAQELPRAIVQITKVRFQEKVYDFGYIGQTGRCIIYEEGECNMQDAIAVRPEDIEAIA